MSFCAFDGVLLPDCVIDRHSCDVIKNDQSVQYLQIYYALLEWLSQMASENRESNIIMTGRRTT